MQTEELEYVGFWPRLGATLVDSLLIGIIIWPALMKIYGDAYWTTEQIILGPADFLLSWVLPAIAVMAFWMVKQATPGKLLISAKIVDARTGGAPSTGQYIGRYLGYFVAILPLCIGLLWVAFDDRKQGWHDKLAGTVVIRPKDRSAKSVSFED